MKRVKVDDVAYYIFEHIEATGMVRHGFTTKHGGISEGVFSTMNLSYTRGDTPSNVSENIKRASSAMGMHKGKTVFCQQVHGNKVVCANENLMNCRDIYPEAVLETDGLVTNISGLILCTIHADCVPLFFIDPVRKAIGMAHAGWRGTLNDIAKKAVNQMKQRFTCKPTDILVGIGPSIGGCCFEVGKDVAEKFSNKFGFTGEIIQREGGKYKIDLQKANEEVLINTGILRSNIESARICTMCHGEDFFSHRRDGVARGSMAAFIQLI